MLAQSFHLLDKFGAPRTFTRIDPPGPAISVSARCMMRRSQERPLSGDASQYDVQFYVRHGALVDVGFPVPPVKGDRIVFGQATHVVNNVEPLHDGRGAVGGYRLWCRGH